jgi:hypothetical protein
MMCIEYHAIVNGSQNMPKHPSLTFKTNVLKEVTENFSALLKVENLIITAIWGPLNKRLSEREKVFNTSSKMKPVSMLLDKKNNLKTETR